VERASVEWSSGKDPDFMCEVWSTPSLIEAILAALLEDAENLRRALRALEGTKPA
jgi:hypothetical protein